MGAFGGEEKLRNVRLLDVAILLHHMHLADRTSTIGFADTRETSNSLTRALNATMAVEPSRVESLLWSSNLLHEQKKWWHPYHENFDAWLRDLLGNGESFHRIYNYIQKEKICRPNAKKRE